MRSSTAIPFTLILWFLVPQRALADDPGPGTSQCITGDCVAGTASPSSSGAGSGSDIDVGTWGYTPPPRGGCDYGWHLCGDEGECCPNPWTQVHPGDTGYSQRSAPSAPPPPPPPPPDPDSWNRSAPPRAGERATIPVFAGGDVPAAEAAAMKRDLQQRDHIVGAALSQTSILGVTIPKSDSWSTPWPVHVAGKVAQGGKDVDIAVTHDSGAPPHLPRATLKEFVRGKVAWYRKTEVEREADKATELQREHVGERAARDQERIGEYWKDLDEVIGKLGHADTEIGEEDVQQIVVQPAKGGPLQGLRTAKEWLQKAKEIVVQFSPTRKLLAGGL